MWCPASEQVLSAFSPQLSNYNFFLPHKHRHIHNMIETNVWNLSNATHINLVSILYDHNTAFFSSSQFLSLTTSRKWEVAVSDIIVLLSQGSNMVPLGVSGKSVIPRETWYYFQVFPRGGVFKNFTFHCCKQEAGNPLPQPGEWQPFYQQCLPYFPEQCRLGKFWAPGPSHYLQWT